MAHVVLRHRQRLISKACSENLELVELNLDLITLLLRDLGGNPRNARNLKMARRVYKRRHETLTRRAS